MAIRISILDARVPAERAAWCQLLASWSGREPYAHPAYVTAFARPGQLPVAACWASREGGILLPLIVRPLAAEPWAPPDCTWLDAVSPYGYGGPYTWGAGASMVDAFWDALEAWLARRGVVTLFARLSLFAGSVASFRGDVSERFQNVVCDLRGDDDSLWRGYDRKVRKNVKRARSCGVRVERDDSGARLDDFLRIYEATMDRRDAGSRFYFARSFFEQLIDELSDQVVFFHAVRDGRVISTELVLASERHLYSFLGGTDAEEFGCRPNDLLKHEIMLWGQRTGRTEFVLGGGYGADDGIFRYKRAFCPGGVVPFCVGTRVLDAQAVESLVRARRTFERSRGVDWSPTTGFFPAYRS